MLDWVNDKPARIENESLPFDILRIIIAQNGDQPSCLNLSRTCQRQKRFYGGVRRNSNQQKASLAFLCSAHDVNDKECEICVVLRDTQRLKEIL